MNHLSSKSLPCFALLILSAAAIASDDQGNVSTSSTTPAEIAHLIQQLEHPDFSQREAATRQLQQTGEIAITALLEASQSQSPEVATRSLQVLEDLFLSDDPATFIAVDDALNELMDSTQGMVVVAASQILARHMLLREKRAVQIIRDLGGTVQYGTIEDSYASQQRFMMGPTSRSRPFEVYPRIIILGKKWTGGLEALKYLRWLAHRDDLTLYVVRGNGVPLADAQALGATLPNLNVLERGPYLGLVGRSGDQPICDVDDVAPDGPAMQAGLRPGDTILKLEDKKVGPFQDLIDQLKEYEIGQTVTITVRRNGETKALEVVLGEWKMSDYSDNAQRAIEQTEQIKSNPRALDTPPNSIPSDPFDDRLIEK
ncbi:MAG: PDZ domain-containing protein [Planctomycetaceae bacterium]|nr:PDZ domain-containing protein [Planctomycetaceae bacterium]